MYATVTFAEQMLSRCDDRSTFFARALEAFVQRRRQAATRAELEALSDRDLEDIGIARWQIEDTAAQAVRSRR